MRRLSVLIAVAGALGGCATGAPRGSSAAGALAGSLEVAVVRDTAYLTLHATNVSEGPVVLEFASAQRYDFEVWTEGGERVWSWSADRSFAQVRGEERVAAGATLRERVAWPTGGRTGEFVAVGRLQAAGAPLELSARFRVAQP